jgi:hypothetical protein
MFVIQAPVFEDDISGNVSKSETNQPILFFPLSAKRLGENWIIIKCCFLLRRGHRGVFPSILGEVRLVGQV